MEVKTGDRLALSGMQAAYAHSNAAMIFPITPASHMKERATNKRGLDSFLKAYASGDDH